MLWAISCHAEDAETALGVAWSAASTEDDLHMGRIMWTGKLLSVLPSTVNDMELGAQEWMDNFFLRYGIEIINLPDHCGGCGPSLDIYHALD